MINLGNVVLILEPVWLYRATDLDSKDDQRPPSRVFISIICQMVPAMVPFNHCAGWYLREIYIILDQWNWS